MRRRKGKRRKKRKKEKKEEGKKEKKNEFLIFCALFDDSYLNIYLFMHISPPTISHIATLRGHIGQVFQVCWSADSRLLCSCSADKTLKVWNTSGKMIRHLTQHQDKVVACFFLFFPFSKSIFIA